MADANKEVIIDIKVDYADTIERIAQLRKESDALRATNEELKKDRKEQKISVDEYNKALSANKIELDKNAASIRVLEKEVKNEIKSRQQAEGSLTGLRGKLSNLTAEYDRLSKAERESTKGTGLQENIAQTVEELEKAEQATGRYQRQVGNYTAVTKSLRAELKDLTNQLTGMTAAGQNGSEAYAEVSKRAGELADILGDVKKEIKDLASDSKNFDTLAQGVQGVVAAYGLWQSASAAMGVENKELDRIMKSMVVVMGTLQSLTVIQNLLQKQSNVYRAADILLQKIGINQTKQEVATLAAKNAMLSATTLWTKAVTAATWLWNAALNANPVVLVATGIAGLVAVGYGLVSWLSTSGKAADNAAKAMKVYEDIVRKTDNALEAINGKLADNTAELKLNAAKAIEAAKARGASTKEIAAIELQLTKDVAAAETQAAKDRIAVNEKLISSTYNTILAQQAVIDSSRVGSKRYKEATLEVENLRKEYDRLKFSLAADAREIEQQALGVTTAIREQTETGIKATADTQKQAAADAKERATKEREAIRQAQDAMLTLIKDGAEQQRQALLLSYGRQIEDLKRKLSEEKNLTAAARAAINQTIIATQKQLNDSLAKLEDERLSKLADKEAKRIELRLAAVKKDSEAELSLKLQLLEQQRTAEIVANSKLTEELRQSEADINAKYDAQAEATRKANAEARRTAMANEATLEWENKIAEAQLRGEQTLQLEIDRKKVELDALQQLEGESDAAFKARKLEAEQAYVDAKKALENQEVANAKAKEAAIKSTVMSTIALLEELGEENKALAVASKVIALAQIAVDTGKAISAGVASAMSVPFPANIAAVATTIATVMANITTAIKTVKSAKFAEGGLVTGAGSGTSDGVNAKLSTGESVMTALATSMFSPYLSVFNQLGGGVPISTASTAANVEGDDMLANAFIRGAASLPAPVVAVREIAEVQNKVAIYDQLSRA